MIPSEARRYFITLESGCTGWKGRKYYGRPAWTLWMQRAVWEEVNGAIPPRSTIDQTCGTIGCLSPDHLAIKTKPKRERAVRCKNCGSQLSRDKNDKTYCQICLADKARKRRARVQDNPDII